MADSIMVHEFTGRAHTIIQAIEGVFGGILAYVLKKKITMYLMSLQ